MLEELVDHHVVFKVDKQENFIYLKTLTPLLPHELQCTIHSVACKFHCGSYLNVNQYNVP